MAMTKPLGTQIDFSSGDLSIDTNTLHVDSTNNRVGVGTSSPASTLQVGDENTTSNTLITVESANNTLAGIDLMGDLSGSKGFRIKYEGNGNYFAIEDNTSSVLTERMRIDSGGNVGIGTTQPQRSLVNKGQRRIISSDAVSYDENRWFTHEAHYNIAGVTNTAWTNLVTWQPYLNGTSNNPGASSLWTRVLIEVRAGGHTSAVGSGDIHAIYSADYNGSGCSGVTTKNTLFNDAAAPDIGFAISGWSVTLQIRGASGTTGSVGGYCYVKIHFGGGEGSASEAYEWSVTDYE